MSISSQASLGSIRLQAQQRSDLENNPNVSTSEWNQYLSQSYKELYDLLVGAYGNDYYVKTPYLLTLTGSQFYNLPSDFYKLLGVDLQYSSSPTGWITMPRYEFIDRNKYQYPNTTATFAGNTNLRYRIVGNQIAFIPIPSSNQATQIWYIPKPTSLQFIPICATTANSTTISTPDVSDLTVGMSVSGSGIIANTTIVSINTGANTFVISNVALLNQPFSAVSCWRDDTNFDGISGWEEYVIIDAAIKAGIKQETDIGPLQGQKAEMHQRIVEMAEGRDAGQAHHTSDALAIQGYDGAGGGIDGSGWGY